MAAVLACGDRAVLSGLAAAFLFGLVKGTAPVPEVTTVAYRRVAGITTRRVRHLDEREVAFHRAIPITTVPLAVVDLAGHLSLDDLARACHEAQVRHRISGAMVDAALARRPNVTGARKLREIFRGEVSVTLSELERRFLLLLRSNGVPPPETNRRVDGSSVDCRWPASRSSSTATATTTLAMPGSRIVVATGRRVHAAMSSGDTPTAM
jgi:hypothetical protein